MSKKIEHIDPYVHEEEITLKDFILNIQSFIQEVWTRKLLVLLSATIVGMAFFLKAYLTDTEYESGMRFLVSTGASSEQRSTISPYSPFELVYIENNKITELARSGRIIHQVLMEEVEIDGHRDYLGNHLIDIYDLQDEWAKEAGNERFRDLSLDQFRFTRDSISLFTNRERRALNALQELVAGNRITGSKGIMTISYNDITDIFSLKIMVKNETISITLLNHIYAQLQAFYVEEAVGRPFKLYVTTSMEYDSLKTEINRIERQLALAKDRSRSVLSGLNSLNISKLERDQKSISNSLDQAYKRKNNLETVLQSETPDFEIIDQSFIPVEHKPSLIKLTLTGSILGFILGVFGVVMRKIYRDAMAS